MPLLSRRRFHLSGELRAVGEEVAQPGHRLIFVTEHRFRLRHDAGQSVLDVHKDAVNGVLAQALARLPVSDLAAFTDVSQLLVNQCCELRVNGHGKSAWGIYKQHDGVGYLRRVQVRNGERFGPCNHEQACAHDLILDDQTLVVSLVGMAGTGKTLMALLSAFELYRAGRVSKIEVYRLNAEAGRQLGYLPGGVGDKMAPWAKPILDNLDLIVRRLASPRFSNHVAESASDRRESGPTPTVEDLLARNVLEIARDNAKRLGVGHRLHGLPRRLAGVERASCVPA